MRNRLFQGSAELLLPQYEVALWGIHCRASERQPPQMVGVVGLSNGSTRKDRPGSGWLVPVQLNGQHVLPNAVRGHHSSARRSRYLDIVGTARGMVTHVARLGERARKRDHVLGQDLVH